MTKKRTEIAKKKRSKPDAGTGDRKTKAGSGKKCWHFSHWLARFEMDEYRRQGGLDYIRMFVTATTAGKSNESTEFFQQLAELKHYYSDQYYCYVGIFWTLGSLTATKEDWLRGYLIDADLEPLNESKLAARLGIDKKKARQAMAALKRVGLIEYIDCPLFVPAQQDQKKKSGKKPIRKRSETFGNISKPFKNKNSKRNSKRNSNEKEKQKEKKRTGLNAAKSNGKRRTEQREPEKPDRTSQAEQRAEGREQTEEPEKPDRTSPAEQRAESREQTEEQRETEEPENPENPVSPIDSEAGPARALHIVPKPARSAIRHSSPQQLGSVLAERFPDHWQDRDSEAFGWSIVRALGYPDDRQDEQIRSEWGSFAAWWSKVKVGSPVTVLDDLRATAIRKANYLRLKGRSARNKSAVWFHIMAGEMNRRGMTTTQPARASPAR